MTDAPVEPSAATDTTSPTPPTDTSSDAPPSAAGATPTASGPAAPPDAASVVAQTQAAKEQTSAIPSVFDGSTASLRLEVLRTAQLVGSPSDPGHPATPDEVVQRADTYWDWMTK